MLNINMECGRSQIAHFNYTSKNTLSQGIYQPHIILACEYIVLQSIYMN